MVCRQAQGSWLILSLALGLVGCGRSPHTGNSIFPWDSPPPPAKVQPPEAAPALYIPGPPRAVPRNDDAVVEASLSTPQDAGDGGMPPLVPVKAVSQPVVEEKTVPASPIKELLDQASRSVAAMNSYTVRFRRREVVNGRKMPEELILLKFRREPLSVYCKWLGVEGHNREVTYVQGKYKNMLHSRLAAGDIPFVGAGSRWELPADSHLVKSKSRHPITEAGLQNLVAQINRTVAGVEKGDPRFGTLKYLGSLKRPEFPNPVKAIQQVIAPRQDPLLPQGGQRWIFFDPEQKHLPVLLITHDHTGQEVEYYCHDRIIVEIFDDDDFNPDKLWPKR